MDAGDFRLLGIMVVSIVAHELLHGVGFSVFGRIPRREVRYGFIWWVVLPYATSSGTLTVAAYRWTCLLPGIVLGAAPALLGVFVGHVPTMAYGAAMLGISAGDLVALWTTRDLSPSSLVRDNPGGVGCLVVQASDGGRAE